MKIKSPSFSQPPLKSQAAVFLESASKMMRRLQASETELNMIAEGVTQVTRSQHGASFFRQFSQFDGDFRFARRRIEHAKQSMELMVRSYPNCSIRATSRSEFQKELIQVDAAVREVRHHWRELSATYHIMRGVNGIL